MSRKATTVLGATCVSMSLTASAQFITPPDNLLIVGIPAIEVELTKKVGAYTGFNPSTILAWHPQNASLLIRSRHNNSQQLHMVGGAGERPQVVTEFTDAVGDAWFEPQKGAYVVFERGIGGDEVMRLFRLDVAGKQVAPISPEHERASAPSWSRTGDRIVFSTTTIDKSNQGAGADRAATTRLYIVDPQQPEKIKLIASFDGGRLSDFRFSPDEKSLVYLQTVAANEAHLWLLDIATGKKSAITPKRDGHVVAYSAGRFAADGKSLFATSNRDSEFNRLVQIDLATGNEQVLTGRLNFDVDEFSVSNVTKRIAFVTNENGVSVLRFLDLDSKKELLRPALLPGEITNLHWQSTAAEKNSTEAGTDLLAFTLASAKSPGEVFVYDVKTTKLTRWTNGAAPGLNPQAFVEPKLIQWKSFDALTISGFAYQPDATLFAGKRPVVIVIHGGPAKQARANFIARNNYLVNELGLTLIYPNVRGSSGYGKSYLAADDGYKREDAVKDIGALFDWIANQPDMDAGRVLVMGGSYGGYMTMAVATHYPDKIVGGISSVGISSFVTFLTNTESYRRDLRRDEYGDERIPAMRAFMEKISPLNNAGKMKKPMLIVQGKNDPRVPYTESLQIVDKLKKQNTPVWFLMADDEGHGFVKKSNLDYLFYSHIKFIEKTLLSK